MEVAIKEAGGLVEGHGLAVERERDSRQSLGGVREIR